MLYQRAVITSREISGGKSLPKAAASVSAKLLNHCTEATARPVSVSEWKARTTGNVAIKPNHRRNVDILNSAQSDTESFAQDPG